MIDYQVHDDFDILFMSLRKQFVEILHRAEFVHDCLIIADIVAVVVIWGLVDGGKPDNVDAKIAQIIQTGGNSLQIADTVSVAVHETAGINLINDRFLPPCFVHVRVSFLLTEVCYTLTSMPPPGGTNHHTIISVPIRKFYRQ